ncbi:MAG: aminotransferase class V-fold PLP-dependent enzyme [Thermococci archaeon]|nr:aminotransferase class V-fold PLP-dependent enzyme [Thermococci archaeon]
MRRSLFPALRRFKAYLNTASTGLMPSTAVLEVTKLLDEVAEFRGEVNSVDYMDEVFLNPALEEAARLMRVKRDNLGLSVQTTEGLRRVLFSLEPARGQNVVAIDLEFPTIPALLKSYARRFGLELRVVENRDGFYSLDDFERLIDDSTFAVVLSSVNWITGQRLDLVEISRMAHEHGAWLIVDGVQELGSLRIFPEKVGVDSLVAGGEKWLLSPNTGAGLIYASDGLLEEARPVSGLLNCEPPTKTWGDWWGLPDKDPWGELKPASGARKIDFGGGPPYIVAAALRASLRLLNEIGIDAVEHHNLRLAERIADEAEAEGMEVIARGSQIVTIKTGLSYPEEDELYQRLAEAGVSVSHRGARGCYGIRVSPHLYNTEEDVDTFMAELLDALGR